MADEDLDLLGIAKPKVKKVREKREIVVVKNARDAQRLHLDKLMKNPEKEVFIPEKRTEKKSFRTPDFVRNVMGSSAGAGSGEFHVYRQLRKKENMRLRVMEEQAERERLDDEFKAKIEANKRAAEQKTAKKRAKRQKRKEKLKNNRNKKPAADEKQSSEQEESEDNDQDDGQEDEKPNEVAEGVTESVEQKEHSTDETKGEVKKDAEVGESSKEV